MIGLVRPWLARLVIHRDGNIATFDAMESLGAQSFGMPASRSRCPPVTMPDEKAELLATCAARGRDHAPAAPRHVTPRHATPA